MDKAYNLCKAQGKLSELSAMLVTMTKSHGRGEAEGRKTLLWLAHLRQKFVFEGHGESVRQASWGQLTSSSTSSGRDSGRGRRGGV